MIIEKNQHEQNPNEIIQRIKGHKNSTQFKLCDNCVPNLVKFNLYLYIFFLHSNEVLLVDYNSRTSLSLKSSSNRNIDL